MAPSNAFPDYIEAVAALAAGDGERLIAAVERGNQKQHCQFIPPPWPRRTRISFPKVEPYTRFWGRPVPRHVLRDAAERLAFIEYIRVNNALGRVALWLLTPANGSGERARSVSSVRHLEALAKMGCQLIRARPCDDVRILLGVSIAWLPLEQLRATYAEPYQIERVDHLEAELSRIRASIASERPVQDLEPWPVGLTRDDHARAKRRQGLEAIIADADLW